MRGGSLSTTVCGDMVGIAGEAVPWSARQAVLRRLRHDLVGGAVLGRLGQPEQPDAEEALFAVAAMAG